MSAPPPTSNPDTRVLPEGWVTQLDSNYNAWYYVNTRQTPPEVTWTHPLGPPPPPPQQYGPPAGPPPPNQTYGGPGYDHNGYGQATFLPAATGKAPKAGMGGMLGGLLGGKLGGKLARSMSGHGYPGAGYGYGYTVPQQGAVPPAGTSAGIQSDLNAIALYDAGFNAGAATGYPRKNPADFI